MKRNELIILRELLMEEINKRKRINYLLEQDLIKEYLELANIKSKELDTLNINKILNEILKDYKITKTNNIFVCTNSYYLDYDICYEDTNYYTREVSINSEYAERRIYKDIESGKIIRATKELNDYFKRPLINDFEKDNIVLNPYNTCNKENGYNEVRLDFFKEAINKGQAKAKQKILKKYNRI